MNASTFRALTLLLVLSLAAAYARMNLANGTTPTIDLTRPGMPLPETMTDRRLHERLQRRLDHEAGASKVTIEVHDGIATLGGVVVEQKDKTRVAEIAVDTSGIVSVRNRIYVDRPDATEPHSAPAPASHDTTARAPRSRKLAERSRERLASRLQPEHTADAAAAERLAAD